MSIAAPLSGATLVHIGMVCRDLDLSREQLSRTLGVQWAGGEPEPWSLVIAGEVRELTMRIAHSVAGTPRYELIQAVADTPWQTDGDVSLHHLCYHSSDSARLCEELEAQGYRRVLGSPGDPSGYFQAAVGLLIEIVDNGLLAYLDGFRGS